MAKPAALALFALGLALPNIAFAQVNFSNSKYSADELDPLLAGFHKRADLLIVSCDPHLETELEADIAKYYKPRVAPIIDVEARREDFPPGYEWKFVQLLSKFRGRCNPQAIYREVDEAIYECDRDRAIEAIGRLEKLVRLRKQLVFQTRELGDYSKISTKEARNLERIAEKHLNDARSALRKYERGECPEKKVGDARASGEEALPPELREDEAATRNVCDNPPVGELAEACGSWEPLLGRWTSRKHGGAIELSLGADGVLIGRIISTNEVMERNGYAAGMEVLRGWTYGYSDRGTWLIAALDGEFFQAVKPDREPGEPYGDPLWIKAGTIFIAKDSPGRLQMPAGLESGLSDYDPWIKMGTVSPAI